MCHVPRDVSLKDAVGFAGCNSIHQDVRNKRNVLPGGVNPLCLSVQKERDESSAMDDFSFFVRFFW